MLCLDRWEGEEVVLSKDGVELGRVVLVRTVSRGKARFGFTFPRDIEVDRAEIYDAKKQSQTERNPS